MKLRKLTQEEKRVIINRDTEAPFSGEYVRTFKQGTYVCKQCGAPLYRSEDKFDARCGWPSFDACVEGSIIERPDYSLSRARTEILCSRCGGHLGHVFPDGPTPTGLRYCVNSLAIDFDEAKN